jgi:homoserine dehydrogenase
MQRLVVLKFGGSVLRDEDALRLAVHEIYRWWRAGHGVVAVVSALAGRTDECLRVAHAVCASPAPEAVAAFVATGELAAAALLGLQLDRAGVPARVLSPAALRLTAVGPALDASPDALDPQPLRRALVQGEVVVVPGYVAQDEAGRTVVLGRGGSDQSALFLAQRLGARCRLVKDVDGLYVHDPARAGPPPARYAQASYAAALACDGTIVQKKALLFARDHGLAFELGGLNGRRPTRIGAGPDAFASAEEPRRLRVALLGCGTVGSGVLALLQALPRQFELVALALRDADKSRDVDLPHALLVQDPLEAARCGADVVVELLGGLHPARAAIAIALEHGASVVTANKRVLARSGAGLQALARSRGRALLASAAVGGSMPLLERLALSPARSVRRVRGVLNATTGFVLGRLAEGRDLPAALAEARSLGLAEADATRDLAGQDAADKLRVIAGALDVAPPRRVTRQPLSEAVLRTLGRAPRVHQIAELALHTVQTRAEVRLVELDHADPLAGVRGVHNAALIEHADGSSELVRGKGAGRWPTAEAVLADLLLLGRRAAHRAEEQQPSRRVG